MKRTTFIICALFGLIAFGQEYGWKIDQAEYSQQFSVSVQSTDPQDVYIREDGTVMYVLDGMGKTVHEYDLTTPWDVSSAVHSKSVLVSTAGGFVNGFFFKPDGTRMYTVQNGSSVNQLDLSTAWDLSTAVDSGAGFQIIDEDRGPSDVFIGDKGSKVFIVGYTTGSIFYYDMDFDWDLRQIRNKKTFSVKQWEANPTGIYFNSAGTLMYIVGNSTDSVHKFSVKSKYPDYWDPSYSNYIDSFSLADHETTPTGIFFMPDGYSMYISGKDALSVHQYNLVDPEPVLAPAEFGRDNVLLRSHGSMYYAQPTTITVSDRGGMNIPDALTVQGSVTLLGSLFDSNKTWGYSGQVLSSTGFKTKWVNIGAEGHTIQSSGTDQTQRTILNFTGTGVVVEDDATNQATKVTITDTPPTGLENITEGIYSGWRLVDMDPANYGNIGSNAVDLSTSYLSSTTKGATGDVSFASGENNTAGGLGSAVVGGNANNASNQYSAILGGKSNTASGRNSTVLAGEGNTAPSYGEVVVGTYSTTYSLEDANTSPIESHPKDRIFNVGVGTKTTTTISRADAFTILKNGTITAPELSNAEIEAAGDQALITKLYADKNYHTGTDNQQLTLSTDNKLSIEDGNWVSLAGYLDNTDDQDLKEANLNANNVLKIEIENGASTTVDLSALDDPGTDDQTLSLTANTLGLEDGGSVDLAKYLDNTDDQTLTLSTNTLALVDGGSVDLAKYLDNTDNQDLVGASLNTSNILQIDIDNGVSATVDLSALDDTGTDNQNISGSVLTGTKLTIGIENGFSETIDLSSLKDGTGTDDQTLSLSGNTLAIERGNNVSLSKYLDNTDNQNIQNLAINTSSNLLTVGIEDGTSKTVDLSHLDNSGTDDQKIDVFSLSGTSLLLSLESDGQPTKSVNLSSLKDGTGSDNQTLSISGNTLRIESGNSVSLSGINTRTRVPVGAIIMWSGSVSSLPTGWYLCNGSNGTPDLSGRFIVGYDTSDSNYNAIGDKGGAKSVTLTVGQMPSHTHYAYTTDGDHSHQFQLRQDSYGSGDGPSLTNNTEHKDEGYKTFYTKSASHHHSFNTYATGSNGAHENRPPYYTLAFIMFKG